ncbi:MAG: RHS repeat-associated core domain-containing protein [Patescibacteria group bacterium]
MRTFAAALIIILVSAAFSPATTGCSGSPGTTSDSSFSSNQKGTIYYLDDHLGSANLVTDSLGNVLREESRYPYGLDRRIENAGAVTADYVYTGKELDEETGLVYFGKRYYSPEMGRWITPDPLFVEKPKTSIEKPSSSNLYTYVRSNPESYVDGDGFVENYTFYEKPLSERDIADVAPRNVYEKMYIETLAIVATGGVAGPLLADDGSGIIGAANAAGGCGGGSSLMGLAWHDASLGGILWCILIAVSAIAAARMVQVKVRRKQ